LLKNYASTYSSKPAQQQYLLADKKIINNIALKLIRLERAITSINRRKLLPNIRVLEKRATSVIP
jgi:hypothetical protein